MTAVDPALDTALDTAPLGASLDTAVGLAGPGALVVHSHDVVDARDDLLGFGGLHGGLALALVARSMQDHAGGLALRSVTGRYLRPARGTLTVETDLVRGGERVAFTSGTVQCEAPDGTRRVVLEAAATFGVGETTPDHAPVAPDAPGPESCPVFTIPLDFVPFAVHTEIRPVTDARPFAGGADPELVAWIRLVEDDESPDLARLIVLADALAPAHSALLATPTLVPTVELTVRPGVGLGRNTSPWVLAHVRTHGAAQGWIDESIDLFDPEGRHLASAQQLRVALT